MKKKLLVLLLICSVALTCAACGNEKENRTHGRENYTPKTLDWDLSRSADMETNQDVQLIFNKALKTNTTGATYDAISYLANQVSTEGMGYAVLCRAQPVAQGASAYYAVVYMFHDLKGNATITDVQPVTIGFPPLPEIK